MCHDLKVFPKARMIIRETESTDLDYSNYCLLDKSAMAVGEAIKRYSLLIDSINLSNNGLKSKDCIMLITSLQRHYNNLQKLTLSQNKLGFEGANYLAE